MSETRRSEGSATGTTVDASTNVVDIDTRGCLYKSIQIFNTGGANSLDYDIYVQANKGGTNVLSSNATLTNGNSVEINLNNYHTTVRINVNSTSAGQSTTFDIEYCVRV